MLSWPYTILARDNHWEEDDLLEGGSIWRWIDQSFFHYKYHSNSTTTTLTPRHNFDVFNLINLEYTQTWLTIFVICGRWPAAKDWSDCAEALFSFSISPPPEFTSPIDITEDETWFPKSDCTGDYEPARKIACVEGKTKCELVWVFALAKEIPGSQFATTRTLASDDTTQPLGEWHASCL